MRVHGVCKKTGLSRKAVHFYIQEGLISPAKNENGYYDLNESDLKTLEIIPVSYTHLDVYKRQALYPER